VFVYVCAFFCVCVQVEALRRADHPSKESYRLSDQEIEETQPYATKIGSNEEEKKLLGFNTEHSVPQINTLGFFVSVAGH
jgi:hypothetical protein